MHATGVRIDKPRLRQLQTKIDSRLSTIDEELEILADAEGADWKVNFRSWQQVAKLLYDVLKLPILHPKGKRSTDVEALEPLRHHHLIVDKLLEKRKLDKLKGTYVETLLTKTDQYDILRARFNNCAVETGRLSSSGPNFQNVPVRTLPGTPQFVVECIGEVRKCFLPPPGWVWTRFDYSAVEFRIMVILGNDEASIQAINDGIDVHLETACEWNPQWGGYDRALERKIAKDKEIGVKRDFTKNVVYGQGYGQQLPSLLEYAQANGIALTKSQGQAIWSAVMGKRPGLQRYVTMAKQEALANGLARTYFGRQAIYPELKHGYGAKKAHALRSAVNQPVQGSSADIMKIAMARIGERKRDYGMEALACMMVHDEGDFIAPEDEVEKLSGIIVEEATSVVDWKLKLEVEVNTGASWGACK